MSGKELGYFDMISNRRLLRLSSARVAVRIKSKYSTCKGLKIGVVNHKFKMNDDVLVIFHENSKLIIFVNLSIEIFLWIYIF